MFLRRFWVAVLVLMLAGALGAVACGGKKEEAPATSPAGGPGAQKVDESTAGKVTGKAVLDGTAPKNAAIKMNADPFCMREAKGPQTQEYYIVGEGGALQNVFVYVKDGLGNYVWDTPTQPVTIDQKQCRYHPHVFGIRVGQPLDILNSDQTLHNIHAIPKVNEEFNTGQPIQGLKTTHTFTQKEIMVPFKCDVHGWMNAHLGVLDHPYFAVSGSDGKFEIKTLPPGNYVIEAWHEKLGAQTQNVTIGKNETKDITFTFKTAAPTN